MKSSFILGIAGEACCKVAERKRNYSPQRFTAYLLRQRFPWDIVREVGKDN